MEANIKNIAFIDKKILENLFVIRGINVLKDLGYIDDEKAKKSIVQISQFTRSQANK